MSSTPPFRDSADPRPIPSQTEAVVRGIQEMITSGGLAAGDRLPIEKDLAERLSVSRGSLREGIRALAEMGIIESRQGSGTYVTALSPRLLFAPLARAINLQTAESYPHVHTVRRVLEAEAAATAARTIDDSELDSARQVLDAAEELLNADVLDHEAFIQADLAFHRIIAAATRNPVLESLIDALAGETARSRLWRGIVEQGVIAQTQADHRLILQELVAHDPDRARIRMSAHLLGVERFITDHVDETPIP